MRMYRYRSMQIKGATFSSQEQKGTHTHTHSQKEKEKISSVLLKKKVRTKDLVTQCSRFKAGTKREKKKKDLYRYSFSIVRTIIRNMIISTS